jgi:hypothetical protein
MTSNDNTRPTADCTFPFGVAFTSTGADVDGTDPAAVGADDVAVLVWLLVVWVASEFWAVGWVSTVAGEDGVVWTDVLEVGVVVGLTTLVGFAGLTGLTGDCTFVGLVTLFTHVFVVVVQAPITGCPYGLGHVEERVWIMLPV